MKKMMFLVTGFAIAFIVGSFLVAYGGPGPAPNAGDGIPDGSGFIVPPGPIGAGDPFGPNPSAGDGIPDGSSLVPPNGPTMN